MIRKVKCASYCWPDTLSTLGDERCGAVLMPLLYKAIAQRWRARGVGRDRVQAFKIVGREMHLHQESAAPGRSRATRREPRCGYIPGNADSRNETTGVLNAVCH